MPASSRFIQPMRFTVINDVITLPDHDFPNGAGYDITIAGYQRLIRFKHEADKLIAESLSGDGARLTQLASAFLPVA